MEHEIKRLLATVPEACDTLRIQRTTINRLFKAKKLPRVKIGRRTLVPVSALEAYVTSLQEAA